MQLRQFYTERHNLTVGSSVKLSDDEAEHIRKSLRMASGDKIILFNGEKKYLAEVNVVTKDAVTAIVKEVIESAGEQEHQITLIQSLIRAYNFELVIQKATELGVDNIIPIDTEFSQVKAERVDQKLDRWNKISIEACKQSERLNLVNIYSPISFSQIPELDLLSEFDLVFICAVPRLITTKMVEVKPLSSYEKEIKIAKRIAVIIGPEGGFSPTEMQQAAEWQKLKFVKLTANVLKSESAAIAALSYISIVLND